MVPLLTLLVFSVAPCLINGFMPHGMVSRVATARPKTLIMTHQHEHQEVGQSTVTRGEVLRSVAAACVGGVSMWSLSGIEVSAKAPVMKLPDGEQRRAVFFPFNRYSPAHRELLQQYVDFSGTEGVLYGGCAEERDEGDDLTKPAQRNGNKGSIPPFTVLPSGVQITDIIVGDGDVAEAGKGVILKWVMRRSNGYYVSSSSEGDGEPFIYRVGDGKRTIKGLDEGIRGMKAGGTRRIVVPPQLAYVEGCKDGNPGPIPFGVGPKQQINTRKGEPLSFEVKLTKVR